MEAVGTILGGHLMRLHCIIEIYGAKGHLGFCNALVQCHIGHASSLLPSKASASKLIADIWSRVPVCIGSEVGGNSHASQGSSTRCQAAVTEHYVIFTAVCGIHSSPETNPQVSVGWQPAAAIISEC